MHHFPTATFLNSDIKPGSQSAVAKQYSGIRQRLKITLKAILAISVYVSLSLYKV